jgi:hypothetical protein
LRGCVLHIGPGRLGLGLVVELSLRANLITHLVGRPGSKAQVGQFAIKQTGMDQEPLEVASYSEAGAYDELRDTAKDALSSSLSVLLTTAVGGGGDGCAQLLDEVAQERRLRPGGTVFIACENDFDPPFPEIESALRAMEVDCRRAMVNRICPECEVEDGVLVVRADPHAEWLIEGAPDHDVLIQLDALEEVSFVEDIEPFAVRKRWLVNGGHLALGIFGLKDKITSVTAVARNEERHQELVKIQASMVQALPADWKDLLGDSIAYARAELVPMCRTEDEVPRIMHRLQRANPAPFFKTAKKRLAEPAERFLEIHGHTSHQLENVFEALQDVLLDFESYVDSIGVRKGSVVLDPTKDEAAVAAYEEFLAGVLPKEKTIKWSDRFRRELARHRVAYG